MNSIILGYSDVGGKTRAVLVCGPEVPGGEQARIFHDAKANQNFPKGVQRLVMVPFDEVSVAVYLGDEAAKQVQARRAAAEKQQADAAAAAAAAQKRAADLKDAQESFNTAKNRLASLVIRKSALEQRLSDCQANAKALGEDRYVRAAEGAQADLDKCVKEWQAAIKVQESAEKALSKLVNKS